jgi:FkbM family methyltransferase
MPSCVKIGKRIMNEQSILIDITEAAITLKNGTVFMDNYENQSNCATVVGSSIRTAKFLESEQIPVRGININDYLATISEDEIELMKIDCEGMEIEIFNKIKTDKINKIKKLIVEYHEDESEKLITEKLFEFIESQVKTKEKKVTGDELVAMQHNHHH